MIDALVPSRLSVLKDDRSALVSGVLQNTGCKRSVF